MACYLHLFGRPAIDCDGQAVALPLERRHQVLVFLALRRTWVARDELANMLWPGQASKLAFANLRKTLFRLQSLPWGPQVEVQGNAVRFQAGTDVFDFETALGEARIADALRLRTGELLAGFEDDESEAWTQWLDFERERLRGAWRNAALERLGGEIDAPEAIDLSARLLEADAIDEAALRAHMLALARGGQVAGARRAYRDFVSRLQEEYGLAPGAELRALHDALGASGPERPLVRAGAQAPDGGFVGRSVELRRIATQFEREGCRLVSLTGPGGVGKTRLAQRALRDLAAQFADGGAFIPLEDVAETEELASRLARELGIIARGNTKPAVQVTDFLRERHMLLVLDNFEHLLPAADMLEQLLRDCPNLHLLVTTRVRLALASEWSFPVDGLPCPDPEDQDRLEAFDAVRVFVHAAQRVEPAFLAAGEAASIIDICRQLDGLPLALELAGGWTRVLSCEAIAAELRQGLALLKAVDPARPSRHASIEAVFEQSWRLLTAIERDALARLSVFRAGFTVEAANAVAGASLPVLGALIDKSLVRKDGARIFLHPVVQQLAAGRLGEGDVAIATRGAHAQYFHRLMAQMRQPIESADRAALLQLDVECDNCAVAWRWAIAHAQPKLLAQSVSTLMKYTDYRGRSDEALMILRAGLQACPSDADERFRPMLEASIAQLEYRLDQYAEAVATGTRALEAARALRDHRLMLQCANTLGSASLRLGRLAEARGFYQDALEEAQQGAEPRHAAAALDNLALVQKAMGHREEAHRMSLQALEQYRRLGDAAGEALCLNNIGTLLVEMGEHDSALAHLRAALELCERRGLTTTRGLVLANLTEHALKTGDIAAAQGYAQRALEVARQTANRGVEAWLMLQTAQIALRRGDLAAARGDLRSGLEVAIAIGRPALLADGVACFADVLAAQGEADCAIKVKGRPALDMGELAHRIVIETPLAYSPLIASLRAQ